jgi:hypothetical protein
MGGTGASKENDDRQNPISDTEQIKSIFLPGLGNFNFVQCKLHGMATTSLEKTTQFDYDQQNTVQRYLVENDPTFRDSFVKVYDYHLNLSRVIIYLRRTTPEASKKLTYTSRKLMKVFRARSFAEGTRCVHLTWASSCRCSRAFQT